MIRTSKYRNVDDDDQELRGGCWSGNNDCRGCLATMVAQPRWLLSHNGCRGSRLLGYNDYRGKLSLEASFAK